MERLTNKQVRLDPRVKDGYYSDAYFNRTREILLKDNHHPYVKMQVFQRNDNAILCGVDESLVILKESLGSDFNKLEVRSLRDGDMISAWETVMLIEGDYSLFAHLETVYLGALARGTKIATNVYNCATVARGKPILFFPARFDSYLVESKDGYSYDVAMKEVADSLFGGISTDAQGEWWGSKGIGTMPHGLIAAYNGDTVLSAIKFAEYTDPAIKRVVLVDFDNDCVDTTIKVAKALYSRYRDTKDPRYLLHGVRLDNSGTMVDKSIRDQMDNLVYDSSENPCGVTPQLVINVYHALKNEAHGEQKEFFDSVGIIVSGGFDVKKITKFESLKLPVMAYGVGSSMFKGNFDFTADIVSVLNLRTPGYPIWNNLGKKGRKVRTNSRLELVTKENNV